MPLTKSKGDMYPWVSHKHTHIGGECPHKCSYCYVDSRRFGRPARYRGEVRLIAAEFEVKYGERKTIFIEHMNDLWAEEIASAAILKVLEHCAKWPKNTYVFQTKNPARYMQFLSRIPEGSMLGCTIETNRVIPLEVSRAPSPYFRVDAMGSLPDTWRTFVTLEPIMDFDVDVLVEWLERIRPEFVNIGADSKGHHLPEPPAEKVRALLSRLSADGIEVREKHNLGRILGA